MRVYDQARVLWVIITTWCMRTSSCFVDLYHTTLWSDGWMNKRLRLIRQIPDSYNFGLLIQILRDDQSFIFGWWFIKFFYLLINISWQPPSWHQACWMWIDFIPPFSYRRSRYIFRQSNFSNCSLRNYVTMWRDERHNSSPTVIKLSWFRKSRLFLGTGLLGTG